jgi:serine/threonine-protein kinase RsbW
VPSTIKFSLLSRFESVDESAAKADAFAREAGLTDEHIFAIDLAIRESVANAVKHGNKLDETKPVEVELTICDGTLEISVRDYGSGFSPEELPDPTDAENLLKADGRGILFMRTFMDRVEWSHPPGGGTVTKMEKDL